MAIENGSGQRHGEMETTSGRTVELAARLAPAEEQTAKNPVGVETSTFKIHKRLIEEEGTERLLLPHKAVVFVIAVALSFIMFIAYLIATTPSE